MQRSTMNPLACFCLGLQLMTLAPGNDPDLLALAKLMRDAVPALRDMMNSGEGEVTVRVQEGRVILGARTPNYDVLQRVE